VIANPADEAAWRRIVNYPQRGVGDTTIQRLGDFARNWQVPFHVLVADPAKVPDVPPKARDALVALDALVAGFRERFAAEAPSEACRALIRDLRLANELSKTCKDTRELRRRLENLEEVASALASFRNREPEGKLEDFLVRMSLDTRNEKDEDEGADVVTMMTLHAAKGLEFTCVYLCGVEEGMMPHQRVLDGEGDLAEERRLAYVGITRARRLLTMTAAKVRLKFGRVQKRKPSRFLEEIPEGLIDGGRGGMPAPPSEEERKTHAARAFDFMEDLLK
jgi:superfamily I DNA/RNA helicase